MLTQVIDLGKIKFGKPHSFNMTFRNDSNKDVTVTKLVVGCSSCTKAQIRNTILHPSDIGVIETVFTPGTLGKQKKNVSVLTDNGTLKLEFTADVEN